MSHVSEKPTSSRPLDERFAQAAGAVARFRAALDWALTHPDWETGVALSMRQLGFKGQRQGIGFRQAALALSLESKSEAIRCAFRAGLPPPTVAQARRLASIWGEPHRGFDAARARLSKRDWEHLVARVTLRISARYEDYKRAQTELYEAHLPLLEQTARIACRSPQQRDDARQEAAIALLEAIDRIDGEKPFAAYARQWMERRIRNFLMRERSPVKAPINLISKTLRQAPNLSAHEIAEHPFARCLIEGPEPVDDAQLAAAILHDDVPPDEQAAQTDDAQWLRHAMSGLTDKQREVLESRFGFAPMGETASLAEIAARTGISRQQVHQREQRALRALARELSASAVDALAPLR